MKKMSGWQKAGVVVGVGCSSIVLLILIGVVVAVIWARSTIAQYGDNTPTRVERTVPLREPAVAVPGATAAPAARVTGDEPLRLDIDLEEGQFIIRPGPPAGQVQVEGTYAEGLYELTEQHDTTGSGGPHTTIRFRSKAPALARMIAGIGSGSGSRPTMTVTIPAGAAINLSLRVGMGESQIDLGGLTLSELGLDLSMGSHQVEFSKPVAGVLRRVSVKASMGNVSVRDLGNARATIVDASGSMGNLTADLGGAWPGDGADISFNHSMGELTINVPNSVRLETSSTPSQGETNRSTADSTADPAAPLLRLRMTTSMGQGRVVRY